MSLFKLDYSSLTGESPSVNSKRVSNASLSGVSLNESTSSISIDSVVSRESDENYDYMAECYTFLMDYNRSFFNANKELYKTIMESGDNAEVINEGFGDFFSKIRDIIKKFLEWIKKIFAKFVTKLNSLFKSEKYLIKNKAEFSKFTTEDEFSFEGYKYTVDIAAPNADNIDINFDNTSGGITGAFDNVSNTSGTLDVDKLKAAYEKWEDGEDDFFDRFRGEVLGEQGDIPASMFEEECFMKFRDGAKEKHTIHITSADVNDAYSRFSNYNTLKSAIEKSKNSIDKGYTTLERYFEKAYKFSKDSFRITDYSGGNTYAKTNADLVKANGSSGFDSDMDIKTSTTSATNTSMTVSEKKTLIENFFRARAAQVNMMSNIHGIAFNAKLTAAKDCFNQDKAILYKALAKIKGHSVKNK
jgi:hypothetical protein